MKNDPALIEIMAWRQSGLVYRRRFAYIGPIELNDRVSVSEATLL